MSKYGITPNGFQKKRLDEIWKDIHEKLTEGFGVNTTLNPQSFLNVQVTALADSIAELWEVAEAAYYSAYPSSATGISLDNAVEYGGIRRIGEQKTFYPIHCTGDDGTIIPEGTKLASETKPAMFFTASQSAGITRSYFNTVIIKVVALQLNAVYTVGINGSVFSVSSGDDPDATTILQGLADKIKSDEYMVKVEDERLTITHTNLQRGNQLILSENMTTEQVTTIINFASEDYGEYLLPDGSITRIVTNVMGLSSCINLIPPVLGRHKETDVELRQSYINRIAVRSDGMLESITSAILDNVQGVQSIQPYKNDTNIYDSEGRPPHSIEIVVEGGDELAIGKEILRKKAGGIEAFGSVKVDVPDLYGRTNPVCFNRPQYVYVWLKVTLTRNLQQPMPSNFAELTKKAILAQTQDIPPGVGVLTQKLISDIYKQVTGISYVDISAFSSTDAGRTPDSYPLENVNVGVRQKAVIEEKRIEVILGDSQQTIRQFSPAI